MKYLKPLYTKELYDGSDKYIWLLVFHHSITGNEFFKTEREFLSTNTAGKYSIFGSIDDSYKINDVFEFRLEYPDVDQYDHFTQSINPMAANDDMDINFNSFTNTWDLFSGLRKKNSTSNIETFMDGVSGDYAKFWFIAIGARTSWNGILPGPFGESSIKIYSVNLWIRIKDASFLKNVRDNMVCSMPVSSHSISFINLAYLVILSV